jgi:transcription elongation factor GreA-like protein
MAEEKQFRVGEVVRRNRCVAGIQRITGDRIHLRVLKDLRFRVFEGEVIPREGALEVLRKLPQGFYSCILFRDPERIEELRERDTAGLMRLVLGEYCTPFGKREFHQILVKDDAVVEEAKWNSFWQAAYRSMRADASFGVTEKGAYFLLET